MMVTQSDSPANSARQSDFRILWLPTIFCLLLIAAEVYWLFGSGGFHFGPKQAATGAPIATFEAGRNQVRTKAMGTLVWESPVEKMSLYRNDAIATMEDSEAIVRFGDQSELIVEQNSLVILEEAPAQAAGGTPIVARLVRGSIKRRSAGTAPFLLKLSRAPDAKPVEFNDRAGNSVFRVIYKIQGYDVVVESGAVQVEGRLIPVSTPLPKLKAPRLHKPKIELYQPSGPGALLRFRRWWWPEAEAASPEKKKILIHFSWEAIDEAASYRIQVSKDPSFGEVLKESDVTSSEFQFLLPAPEQRSEIYFRVAGIAKDGGVGEYSAVEKIEVNPVPVSDPAIVMNLPPKIPRKPPAPSPEPAPAIAQATPAPREEPPLRPAPVSSPVATVQAEAVPPPTAPIHALLEYGLQWDRRRFKNSDVNPRDATGSGFVPALLKAELRRSSDNESFWTLGGAYRFEKASPDLPPPSDTALGVGAAHAFVAYGRSTMWAHRLWLYQAGPYVATSKRFQNAGTNYSVQNQWLAGLMLALQNDLEQALLSSQFAWKIQAAFLALGSGGVDLSVELRHALLSSGNWNRVFWGFEAGTRQTGVESSLGAALTLGCWL